MLVFISESIKHLSHHFYQRDLRCYSGTSNKKTDAQSGALSGTKISVVTQSLPATDGQAPGEDSLVMYFQHETGSIRWMWLADNGTWLGGDTTSVIAVNAKNNTPISAVSYTEAGWNVWRVYCMTS